MTRVVLTSGPATSASIADRRAEQHTMRVQHGCCSMHPLSQHLQASTCTARLPWQGHLLLHPQLMTNAAIATIPGCPKDPSKVPAASSCRLHVQQENTIQSALLHLLARGPLLDMRQHSTTNAHTYQERCQCLPTLLLHDTGMWRSIAIQECEKTWECNVAAAGVASSAT